LLRFTSWNVNGLRACVNKNFSDFFKEINSDIFCVQETKMQEGQIVLDLKNYFQIWNSAEKKGYSGTAVFTKSRPENIFLNINNNENHPNEGRVITLEYKKFFLVNCYTPNSQRGLTRLDYRIKWEDDFRNFLINLKSKKPVILCGDLNVAHKEIDLKNPRSNYNNAGFTQKERNKFSELLDSGFIDTFRYLYPEKENIYTWWSYMFSARSKNVGWRIDYFLISENLKEKILKAEIHDNILGSDHCPVSLELDISF